MVIYFCVGGQRARNLEKPFSTVDMIKLSLKLLLKHYKLFDLDLIPMARRDVALQSAKGRATDLTVVPDQRFILMWICSRVDSQIT